MFITINIHTKMYYIIIVGCLWKNAELKADVLNYVADNPEILSKARG